MWQLLPHFPIFLFHRTAEHSIINLGRVAYLFFRWINAEVEWNAKGGIKERIRMHSVSIFSFSFLFFAKSAQSADYLCQATWQPELHYHLGLSQWRGGEWNEARYLRAFSCGAPGRGRCFICRHGGRQQVQMSSCCPAVSVGLFLVG